MAAGTGQSYNRFFCAPSPEDTPEEGDTSADIVMTTIRPLTIEIDAAEMSVWVSAGVTIWELMEYIGHYHTPSAPRGYALGSTPQYVNQTIGGAIATGSHGSSLSHGSLSNQVIGFQVVLANGTITEIYPDNYPLYFRAFQVSVGRLGVVTHVKMRIIKENLVRRRLFLDVTEEDFMPRIRRAQEMYRSTGSLPKWMDNMAFGWNPTNFSFAMYTFRDIESDSSNEELPNDADSDPDEESLDFLEPYLNDRVNAPIDINRTEDGKSVADGVTWEEPIPFEPNLILSDLDSTTLSMERNINFLATWLGNNSRETHQASVSWPRADKEIRLRLRDSYEVAIPVDKIADCLGGALALMESQAPDTGLRGFAYFTLVGKETGLLSVSNDQPRMLMTLVDFVYYNQEVRQSNLPLKRLIAYLVTSPLCSPARLHWGYAGWPDPGCWNGAEFYPDTWCDFGCVVRDLDPEDKFIGAVPEVWNWEGANLEECCTADGYNKSLHGCDCAVVRQLHSDECPPPPFYSNR